MRVVGLDLSITATGVAFPDGSLDTWRPHPTLVGDLRLVYLADQIQALADACQPDLVVIEGYVIRSDASGVIGMCHGAVRTQLIYRRVPYVLVPPATLKKYATGAGNAKKPDMRMAFYKRTGIDEPDDNRVDAAWLRLMGLDACALPEVVLPAAQRESLTKVQWPGVEASPS